MATSSSTLVSWNSSYVTRESITVMRTSTFHDQELVGLIPLAKSLSPDDVAGRRLLSDRLHNYQKPLRSPKLAKSKGLTEQSMELTEPILSSSPFFVANIRNSTHDRPAISFHDLGSCARNKNCKWCTILGFQKMSIVQHEKYALTAKRDYWKAFTKGNKIANRVMHLLTSTQSYHASITGVEHKKTEDKLGLMSCSEVALVGGPPCEGHARLLEGTSSFQKVDFHFKTNDAYHDWFNFRSPQLMHFSCPTLKADEMLRRHDGSLSYDSVNIVSGVCLYCAKIVGGPFGPHGEVDIEPLLFNQPTLYEMEYIARSSSAIADVAALIMLNCNRTSSNGPEHRKVPVKIHLDVPSFHYFQDVDCFLEKGRCTTIVALQWMRAVEDRCEQVSSVFKTSVLHELKKRFGSLPLPREFEICISPSRDTIVAKALREALQDGKRPSLQDVVEKLASHGGESWQLFYKLVPAKDRPQDFRGLGYLFYVYHVVKPALRADTSQDQPKESFQGEQSGSSARLERPCGIDQKSPLEKPRPLLISVDDGAERRIYSRTQRLLKEIRRRSERGYTNPNLLEVYLSRKVFINNNESGSNLYLDDPTPAKLKHHFHPPQASQFTDDGCTEPEPQLFTSSRTPTLETVDIISTLFGSECARNLHRWFSEVGLDGR